MWGQTSKAGVNGVINWILKYIQLSRERHVTCTRFFFLPSSFLQFIISCEWTDLGHSIWRLNGANHFFFQSKMSLGFWVHIRRFRLGVGMTAPKKLGNDHFERRRWKNWSDQNVRFIYQEKRNQFNLTKHQIFLMFQILDRWIYIIKFVRQAKYCIYYWSD